MSPRLATLPAALCPLISACQSSPPPEAFEVHPGFAIERVAAEPLVLDPVDLEFDERGRAFVLEMPGYPFPTEAGRVVLLSDEDRDGVYDRRRVFAEDLAVADSILPYRRGLLVASPPDLLLLEDRDDDGVAETRRVLLSGFAVGNPQHNFNGLTHGLDNWIYGANGGNGGELYWPDAPEDKRSLGRDDFRIDLEGRRVEPAWHSSGGFGLAFDSWGRAYTTHNLHHVQHPVFPGRYAAALPGSESDTLDRISDHGSEGPARIFPIGPQETRVNHPEQSGHFSGACGIAVYTGGAFGAELDDDVFVADVVLNLVHRAEVRAAGASLIASRARQGVEFLASRDRAFRPVNVTVGPDGALYVLDMQRAVIEHPEWIPDEIEAGLDLDAGKERGRIYRIAPRAGLERPAVDLDRGRPAELVAALGHSNKWWRDAAQRLLVESRPSGVAPALAEALRAPEQPHRRLHALWTLAGLDALDQTLLLAALGDAHPRVRENAVIVAEPRLGDDAALRDAVVRLASDDDPRVRMQVALSLGAAGAGPLEPLLGIAERDAADPWTRLALLCALADRSLPAARALLGRPAVADSEGGHDLLRRLARRAAPLGAASLIEALAVTGGAPAAARAAALDGLADGLADADRKASTPLAPAAREWLRGLLEGPPSPLARGAWRVARELDLPRTPKQTARLREAGRIALDRSRSSAERLDALGLFELADMSERRAALFELLGAEQPAALQAEAMRQLAAADDSEIAPGLLAIWKSLEPRTRAAAGDLLLRRRQSHGALLTALEQKRVSLGELNLDLERRRRLLRSPDEEVRRRAAALFSDAGVVTRAEALARMRPALALAGDPRRGHDVFAELCARCHRLGGDGVEVGPDLTDAARKSAETLLHEIVDPNAAVETEFVSYTVETRDGRLLTGLVRGESDERVTLLEAEGRHSELPRSEIAAMWTGGLSLMPEELEDGLEPQRMADLLAFLQQPR